MAMEMFGLSPVLFHKNATVSTSLEAVGEQSKHAAIGHSRTTALQNMWKEKHLESYKENTDKDVTSTQGCSS